MRDLCRGSLMEQLVFELAPAEPPRLANFLPGRNAELIDLLRRFVVGQIDETGLLIWGESGAGKTHLLHAAIDLALGRAVTARFFACAADVDPATIAAPPGLVAIDDIDGADAASAGRVFTLFNALKDRGARLLAASRAPLAALPLREDLRT